MMMTEVPEVESNPRISVALVSCVLQIANIGTRADAANRHNKHKTNVTLLRSIVAHETGSSAPRPPPPQAFFRPFLIATVPKCNKAKPALGRKLQCQSKSRRTDAVRLRSERSEFV